MCVFKRQQASSFLFFCLFKGIFSYSTLQTWRPTYHLSQYGDTIVIVSYHFKPCLLGVAFETKALNLVLAAGLEDSWGGGAGRNVTMNCKDVQIKKSWTFVLMLFNCTMQHNFTIHATALKLPLKLCHILLARRTSLEDTTFRYFSWKESSLARINTAEVFIASKTWLYLKEHN